MFIFVFFMSIEKNKGFVYEGFAAEYLFQIGYKILERNYRYKRSEIDLIALERKTLVFVEVKYRRVSQFGYPEQFVSEKQMERIREAATYYLQEKNYSDMLIRFDIIAILAKKENIEHIKDAF